jgi:hypothetical protein
MSKATTQQAGYWSAPVPTHLFEEPGALDQVALLAAEWFRWHLRAR